jgi:hypothetical protein
MKQQSENSEKLTRAIHQMEATLNNLVISKSPTLINNNNSINFSSSLPSSPNKRLRAEINDNEVLTQNSLSNNVNDNNSSNNASQIVPVRNINDGVLGNKNDPLAFQLLTTLKDVTLTELLKNLFLS